MKLILLADGQLFPLGRKSLPTIRPKSITILVLRFETQEKSGQGFPNITQ